MGKPKDGGPAFPGFAHTDGRGSIKQAPHLVNGQIEWELHEPGMSIRDYFAGQVLPGCCADNSEAAEAAKQAYLIADAMLAERAKAVGQ